MFHLCVPLGRAGQQMSGRPMKYPYTLSAKIAQFPWGLYWKNAWVFRYGAFASAITFPIFVMIQNAVYSPSNVQKWTEIRKKELEHH
ncbi:hypothetical protein FJT64_010873 [Amphibalanus amphitrite]|uniref:Cytochrome b-c1 complex subunit 8 n=1 Tax=Amphibalanus amphitrite TaxID=1232801 RepID=A0A6A4VNU5_AMPAM|nr:hypothetical protein FJT64_010873 [Amphibalanus amphitrite]